jgi:hypothetical protein
VTEKAKGNTNDDHENHEQGKYPPESTAAAPHVPRTWPIPRRLLWNSRLLGLLRKCPQWVKQGEEGYGQ